MFIIRQFSIPRLHTYSKIESMERVKLLTYFHVKEDSQTLYGFESPEERNLFVHLISVSGIGPNTARVLLSSLKPEEARSAIISEDVRVISSVKGIGPKTAKRLIIELKDKLIKDSGEETSSVPSAMGSHSIREEALSALLALGFNRIRIQKALNKVLNESSGITDVEVLIKLALKNLS